MNEPESTRSPSPAVGHGPTGRSYPAALAGILILLAIVLILIGVVKKYPLSGNGGLMSEPELVQAITVGGVSPASGETATTNTSSGEKPKVKETKGQDYCPT